MHEGRQVSMLSWLTTNMTSCSNIPSALEMKDPFHCQVFFVSDLKNNQAYSSNVHVDLKGKEFKRQMISA